MPASTKIETVRKKIDGLNKLAYSLRVHDFTRSHKASEEALKLSRKVGYQAGLATSLRSFGFCLVRLGNYDEAKPMLEKALAMHRSSGDLRGQCLAYQYLSIIQRSWANFGKALELGFRSIELSEMANAPELVAENRYQVGITYKLLGQFDKALEYLFASSAYYEETDNPVFRSYPIQGIGAIYFENGNYKKAIEYFKQALKYRQISNDKLGSAGSLDSLGFTYFKLKQYKRAIDHGLRSLSISSTTKDTRAQANAMIHLAEVYKATGDIKKATGLTEQSLAIRRKGGDKRGEADILLFRAGLLTAGKNPGEKKQAPVLLREALRIANMIKATDLQSRAHQRLYEYYKNENNFREANAHLEKHIALEEKIHRNSVNQKMVNLEIARKAEETRKEAEVVMNKNEELTRLNRELEVQTALERVRAVAMGMKKRDDMLDVCTKISLELQSLGVKEIRNVQTAIFYEKRGTYMNYEYYAKHNKTFITETFYTDHKIAKAFAAKMLKGKGEVSFTYITGEKKVKEWLAYQKKTNVFIDTYLEKATSLNYYWHSLGPVALGISTYVPLSNSDSELFKRFLNVFELAYTRYLDIEKAYAQAREAQIEAAVERVRAKALAMHRSEEVLTVVQALKKEMADLGLTTGITAATIFLGQPDGSIRLWDLTSFDAVLKDLDIVFRPDDTDPELYIMKIWRSKENFVVMEQDRKDFERTIKWIRQYDKKTAREIEQLLRTHKLTHGWHPAARLQHGWLCVDLDEKPSAEFETILPKMAAAFDLAYKRFLDLQKAEAQAKEARIEASLEKVRAQALGMHKPEDLLNVCKVLFKELVQLGFDQLRNAVIHTLYDDKGYFLDHDYSDFAGGAITTIPYSNQPIIKTFLREIRKSSDAFLQVIIKGNELADWKNFRKKTGQRDDPRLKKATVLFYYIYSVGTASIGISAFQPVSEEKLDVLKRFRNVFDFAYRRYMDVAKAEEQAREAQIELGLERVRARAMAMHHSEELAELVTTVFNELNRLGFSLTSSIIWINDHANTRNILWIAGAEMKKPAQPFSITPFHKDFFSSVVHAWKAKDPKWVYILKGAKKKSFETAFLKAIPRLPLPLKKALTVPRQVVFSASFNNFGALEIVETEELDEEKFDILHRFGKVFEQTYTRFLDLKKAEAQAAEARVEASLERVRAAAMSMHKSEQLINVVEAMYKELISLGFDNIRNAQISIRNLADNKYFVSEYSDFVRLAVKEAPVDNSPLLKDLYDEMERSKDAFYQKEYSGKDYRVWKKWRLEADPNLDPRILKATSMWFHLYSLGTGYIGISTFGAITPEQTLILKRFRNVFDLAYRRYTDVARAEAQAREAQIEVAVERVRAKALAMHRSEDLHGTVVTLKNELMSLEIPDVIAATIYLEQDDGSIRILDLTAAHEETDEKVELAMDRTFRFEDTDPKLWVRRMWDRKENYFVEYADEEDFKRVVKWLYTVDPANAKIAERIIQDKKITQAWLPTVKLQKGVLNIDLLEPPAHEVESILVKMGASFDLAYKRFLDLQRAEAQAREAQIEVSLEKVRSIAMGMRKSEEMSNVSHVIFKELTNLGFVQIRNTELVFTDDEKGTETTYHYLYEGSKGKAHYSFKNNNLLVLHEKEIKENPDGFAELIIKGNALVKWREFRKKIAAPADLKLENATSLYYYSYSFGKGKLSISSFTPVTSEQLDILERFKNVFELAYQRFIDIEAAESQAREAQIEAALERVRSASMAMHASDELQNVIRVLTDQLSFLGFDFHTANFITNASMPDWEIWISSPGSNIPPKLFVPYFNHRLFNERNEAVASGKEMLTVELNPEEKASFLNYFFEHSMAKNTDDERIKWVLEQPGMALTTVVTRSFSLSVINYYGKPFTEQENEVIKRLAYVFEQSYTRFLDLQKAEEQAREALIEAALERVRSRSMAMHKTDELLDAAELVHKELLGLGINSMNVSYAFVDESEEYGSYYSINPVDGKILPIPFVFPHTETAVMRSILSSWKKQEPVNVIELNDQQTLEHQTYIGNFIHRQLAEKNIPFSVEEFLTISPKQAVISTFNFSKGYLFNIGGSVLSKAEEELLVRFSRVFDQTYIRFLDLQKAEEQARESQIQLALERVRARTMAMQRSDELPDCASLLFHQIQSLGMPTWAAGYCTWEENKDAITLWMSSEGVLQPPFKAPTTEDELFIQMRKGYDEGKSLHVVEMGGDELVAHYRYMRTLPVVGEIFDTVEKAGHPLPVFQVMHYAYFSKGFLLIITYEPVPAAHEIFTRFASVFDQTYTRFLDLQKAEAQARESQIELGLERVRARAMAMQTSDELNGLIGTVFSELTKLDLVLTRCVIMIYDDVTNASTWWMANVEMPDQPSSFYVAYHDHPPAVAYVKAWREGAYRWTYVLEGNVKKEWDKFLFKETDLKNLPGVVIEGMKAPGKVYLNASFNNFGNLTLASLDPLSEEHFNILLRFAKVFDLTYTRFNDLQKAEAQAREARIETALEKVRSRSLAMHTSTELGEVATVVLNNLQDLGYVIDSGAAAHLAIFSEGTKDFVQWSADPVLSSPVRAIIPYTDHPILSDFFEAKANRLDFFARVYTFEQKNTWFKYAFEHSGLKYIPEELKQMLLVSESYAHSIAIEKNSAIIINSITGNQLSENQIDILKRFARVFEQAYIRFLDLQKAEAQAREAQIEAAIERVRSSSLAMHASEELGNVVSVLLDSLHGLGFHDANGSAAHLLIFSKNSKDFVQWSADPFLDTSVRSFIPYSDTVILNDLVKAREVKRSFFSKRYSFEEKNQFFVYAFEQSDLRHLPPGLKQLILDSPTYAHWVAMEENSAISVNSMSDAELSSDQVSILKRVAKVFEQAYIRFLDLQKAEAQTREAKIETSLERVRSKAMAMHSSEDLAATIAVFYREMEALTFTPRRCGVGLINKETRIAELSTMNTTAEGESIEIIGKLKMAGHPVLDGVYDNWLLQKEYHPVLRGKEINEYYALIRPQITFPDYSADTAQFGYFFFFPEGGVYAWTDKELSEEELNIYRRFTSVLSLTYKRYKDLQKAEGQAREAQIEVALERVRSKAMAMHRTDDLNDAVAVVFEELDKLNLGVLRVGISVLNKEQRSGDVWVTSIDKDQAVQVSGDESFDIHPLLHGAFEAWLRQEDFSYVLEGDDLTRYYQAVEAAKFQLPESQMLSSGAEFKRQFCFVAVYNSGGLFAFRETEFPEEAKKVMRRFAGVFDLTYKRFLDLQKAEAQARESQIQLALERVRARTMAMQLSDELAEASVVLFQQFAALGQTPDRISIGIVDEINGTTDVWATNQASTQINIHFKARNDESTTIKKILDEWKAGKKSAMVDLQGEELKKWINYLREELGMSIDDSYFHGRRIHQVSFFSQGWLNITTLEPLPAETLDLLDRFADVFNLTYTRFTDLKKAEAQAQKANIEVALERVRARALAMQEPEELIQVAEVLRHEMGALGVEELETCSIYIHDESIHRTECWYALKNAGNNDNKLINDHFSLELEDTWVGREMLNFFRSPNKQVSIVMKGANRKEWIRYCENRSVPLRGYYGEEIPDRTYHLYKFSHGAIGAAAAGDISKESWDLLKRTASVFSLAYSRFKDLTQARSDLQNLKEEKLRAEKALEDLQVTQRQLVQSEKMASLGELTAGIAHEIQNPLNFVNNFSEVSNELIDEMVEEVAKGNIDEARAIAEDVKQNLEKINHHGKRADGIVKGMLQHSRSSSGQKELTDVNALADEYLRLAYHGLRAKDKTFNAKFEANLDQSLPKISIVPQDIGRVILNLITNAFYVVAEKKKKSQNEYEPAVTVSTKNYNDKIEVKVEDNGSGIPSHVLDKIFQPFFTTKPTGQGTGLGLSLSYDIVKAHGGELKVETSENEGSRFFIYLPVE
jgi:signal transduction histidine kinase/tetratricopeptide (TPR) repeat protein